MSAVRRLRRITVCAAPFWAVLSLGVAAAAEPPADAGGSRQITTPYVALGFNDLGMHCMNGDYSEIMVLPPFNNLHVQVLRRGVEPDIITSGVTVRYIIPTVTHVADRSNFWMYPQPLLGPAPAPNIGLTGHGMSGNFSSTPLRDWEATGIPIVPTDDAGRENPYSLATIEVRQGSTLVARTQSVVPTSTEMSCILCHNMPNVSTASDILIRHDQLHGTTLMQEKPVLCARCHASNALGLPGQAGIPNLSSAMHGAHAPRMSQLPIQLGEVCYACHPGVRTQCQRDVHFARGLTCTTCHGNMQAVGNPARRPWLDEPRCGGCHQSMAPPGYQFEQTGTLYRLSVGHKNVLCASCHGSPHAITPTVTEVDNVQAMKAQGHAGTINDCTVCHTPGPPGSFFHKVDD